MTIADVRALCVSRFKTSLTRPLIIRRLEDVIRALNAADIQGELWLDGSFVTEKIDPEDVDMLVRASADIYDNHPAKRAAIDWASSEDRSRTHSCDAYRWIEYSSSHPLYTDSDDSRGYWTDWFGHSRSGVPKGIVVVSLPAPIP